MFFVFFTSIIISLSPLSFFVKVSPPQKWCSLFDSLGLLKSKKLKSSWSLEKAFLYNQVKRDGRTFIIPIYDKHSKLKSFRAFKVLEYFGKAKGSESSDKLFQEMFNDSLFCLKYPHYRKKIFGVYVIPSFIFEKLKKICIYKKTLSKERLCYMFDLLIEGAINNIPSYYLRLEDTQFNEQEFLLGLRINLEQLKFLADQHLAHVDWSLIMHSSFKQPSRFHNYSSSDWFVDDSEHLFNLPTSDFVTSGNIVWTFPRYSNASISGVRDLEKLLLISSKKGMDRLFRHYIYQTWLYSVSTYICRKRLIFLDDSFESKQKFFSAVYELNQLCQKSLTIFSEVWGEAQDVKLPSSFAESSVYFLTNAYLVLNIEELPYLKNIAQHFLSLLEGNPCSEEIGYYQSLADYSISTKLLTSVTPFLDKKLQVISDRLKLLRYDKSIPLFQVENFLLRPSWSTLVEFLDHSVSSVFNDIDSLVQIDNYLLEDILDDIDYLLFSRGCGAHGFSVLLHCEFFLDRFYSSFSTSQYVCPVTNFIDPNNEDMYLFNEINTLDLSCNQLNPLIKSFKVSPIQKSC